METYKNPALESNTLPLIDIIVEGRIRQDLKDVESLAESIRDNGLLQPIVVEVNDGKYLLRNGGRRYTAFTLLASNKVPSTDPDFFKNIPVRLFSAMPEHQQVKIELEENLRREDMTWQERIIGIVKYHKACRRASLLDKGEGWSQMATGELLNMSQTSVSIAFTVYDHLNEEAVSSCESAQDALKVITSKNLDQAQAEQMRRINIRRAEVAAANSSGVGQVRPGQVLTGIPRVGPSILVSSHQAQPERVEDKVQFTKEQIADFYYIGNCLDLIPKIAERQTINHIICDPPYGIDMDNLEMVGVDRVADTHMVKGNLELLPEFLDVSFKNIAEDGFMCMWYDLDHHEKIREWAIKVGWKVQRWPLIWAKTSPCRNSQAQYNITKATEVCYFFRRSEKSIIKTKRSTNYFQCPSCATAAHPFVKPLDLWGYLIHTVSTEGQTILDPFAGAGSSLAACFRERRTPVGIELDEKHVAEGINYIQEQINKKGILDDILTEPPI